MNGILLVDIFVKVVDDLVAQPRLFAYSNQEQYINFRAEDFKRKLKETVQASTGKSKIKQYLDAYKIFQWIISDKDRYTVVQKINGQAMRVLTVDRRKYDLLKALEWEDIH